MVPVMIQILVPVLGRLQSTLASQPTTTAEKENSDCLQTNLCSLLQVVVTRIVDDVKPSASNCMQCLLGVLAAKNSIAAGESMMAIGAIANALEAEFAMYVDALMPFIFTALQNFEEYEVCAVAVGLVGDVCRAVEGRIAPHCANIMTLLIQCLQSEDLHRSVKPPVLSVFGDVAMALNGDFEPYVQASMTMLQGAIQQSADDDADEEFLEYLNDLREGALEAYTGIFNGMKDGGKAAMLAPGLPALGNFLKLIAEDQYRDPKVTKNACGVIGDVAAALGPAAAPYLKTDFVMSLLRDARNELDDTSLIDWASQQVTNL